MKNDLVYSVQRDYPQIYLACHVDHVRARSSEHGISARDASLLAHLDSAEAQTAGALAAHLGVAASTLSATLMRLESLGLVARTRGGADRRFVAPKLTAKGRAAIASTSVLDAKRVASLLDGLSAPDRRRAAEGLRLLASAAAKLARNAKPVD